MNESYHYHRVCKSVLPTGLPFAAKLFSMVLLTFFFSNYKSFLANFTDFEPEIRPNHANIDTFRSSKE